MQIKKLAKRFLSILNLLIFLSLFIVTIMENNVFADIFGEEQLGNNMAVVSGKAPNCIIITNHRFKIASNKVLVTTLSSIIDINGKKISLKELRIPCVAKITFYQNKNGPDPELISLEVKEYANKVLNHFTDKDPFVRYPE